MGGGAAKGRDLMSFDLDLYFEKNNYLEEYFEVVEPLEFWRFIFPDGECERAGHPEDEKANGILVDLSDRKNPVKRLVFDEHEEIENILGNEFVIMSSITYSGIRRTAENARYMYAMVIDLDGVEMRQLQDLLHQIDHDILPRPMFLVNSGTGFHLYYVFEEPVPMYPHVQVALKEMKYALIRRIWNRYTSTVKEPQMQGVLQGFRVVGTQSKLGSACPVVAFDIGDPVTLEYLNEFVSDAVKIKDIHYKSKLSLQQAKKKYPEWYQSRIVEQQKKKTWVVKEDLYHWWYRRIGEEVTVGHRYFALMCLAIYAKKCRISEEQLEQDAFLLLDHYSGLTDDESNKFTEEDVVAALEMYNESYITFPRDDIARISGLPIVANKRNGLSQKDHLEIARGIKAIKKKQGNLLNDGPPTKKRKIENFIKNNPDASKSEIARSLNMSRTTVTKWYPEIKRQAAAEKIIEDALRK